MNGPSFRRLPPWIERATSADHKSVGLMYIATALSFLAIAATEFALMRIQLIAPDNRMIQPEIFDRLMSAAPVTLVVLALIPLALGLIGYLVPLQAGARGVALPRLHQLSYWLYLFGGVAIYASFLWTAPDAGTMALAPLSDTVFTPSNGTDAWIVGTALATTGFVCFAINLVATLAGALYGGALMSRLGLYRALIAFAWLQALTNLGFCALAMAGKSYAVMVGVIALENLSGGMGTAAFVALLMALCDRRYSATQFALLTALASLARVLAGPPAGFMVQGLGWSGFFAASFALALPAIVLLGRRRALLEALDRPPVHEHTNEGRR